MKRCLYAKPGNRILPIYRQGGENLYLGQGAVTRLQFYEKVQYLLCLNYSINI